jgi:hypothetical protein
MVRNASAESDGNALSLTASQSLADEVLLEEPRSRFREFITLIRVMRDFMRGFRVLHFVGPCVTVFGSARIKSDSRYYDLARKMGTAIAQLGFTVMTGGGAGIRKPLIAAPKTWVAVRSAATLSYRTSKNQTATSITSSRCTTFSSAKRCW